MTDITTPRAPVAPVAPTRLKPLGIDEVTLTGGFWADRQRLNENAMIPHCLHWEHKVGWINNFAAQLRGTLAEERTGRWFADSDVYKLLEAIAWEIGRTGSAELESALEEIVDLIAACQHDDGYVNTRYGNPGQEPRFSDLEMGHELYNVGHLVQAAVARLRTGHGSDDRLVQVAVRAADHVCATFGEGGIERVGGHPEIEVAFVELYRATGDRAYLEQARLFLDRRGTGTLADFELGRAYFQDDIPIRDAQVLRGHAVRALYLLAGAVDAAVELGDDELLDVVEAQYQRTLERRTYITGGMGSHHQDEAFGADWELPADRSYCETCAGVGSIMVAWRLLLARGDLRYADIIERTLYNVVAVSPSADGRAFFYTNTLHQRSVGSVPPQDEASPRSSGSGRAPWFEVSCCPTNVSRTFAQLGTYVATSDDRGIHVLQFASGRIVADLPAGRVTLDIATDYPENGRVRIDVVDAPDALWELTIRVPEWAEGATVDTGDGPRRATAPSVVLNDGLTTGTTIAIDLPMTPRWTYPDDRIDAVRGCVALERGPLVLCAESTDQDGADVGELRVNPSIPATDTPHGIKAAGWRTTFEPDGSPYSARFRDTASRSAAISYIPYYAWANRGPSTMRIWVPTGAEWRHEQTVGTQT